MLQGLGCCSDLVLDIEVSTHEQAHSKAWFRFRAGRVTASRFKAAVHTDLSQPSRSLIKSICYPESLKFSSKATRWGCDHKKTARDAYFERIQDRGLVINPSPRVCPDDYLKSTFNCMY